MDHLCLQVPDIDSAHRAALERGLPLIWGGEVSHVFTGDAFFVAPEATQGVLVELLQPDERAEPGAKGDGLFTQVTMVNTVCADLPGALGQWERNFGLRAESYLRAPEADNRHAMVPTGATGAAYIEVLSPLSPAGKNAAYLDKAGEGLFQFDVRSDDPERAIALLSKAGYRTQRSEGMDQGRTAYFVHPKSSGGVFIAIFPPGPIPSGPVPW